MASLTVFEYTESFRLMIMAFALNGDDEIMNQATRGQERVIQERVIQERRIWKGFTRNEHLRF